MLPDARRAGGTSSPETCLNAPTGAWCSLTVTWMGLSLVSVRSQCTYRCVVLPDICGKDVVSTGEGSQCTYRCVVLPDSAMVTVAVAWVSSQCTYRCVVLPDITKDNLTISTRTVSMHLQVRGAP